MIEVEGINQKEVENLINNKINTLETKIIGLQYFIKHSVDNKYLAGINEAVRYMGQSLETLSDYYILRALTSGDEYLMAGYIFKAVFVKPNIKLKTSYHFMCSPVLTTMIGNTSKEYGILEAGIHFQLEGDDRISGLVDEFKDIFYYDIDYAMKVVENSELRELFRSMN